MPETCKARAFTLYGSLAFLACAAVDVHGTFYELSISSPGDQGKSHELYTGSLPHFGTIAKAVRMATVMAQNIRHHESNCTR
mgnify:CR=1 FL=1|jgi:hypothetical protein